MLFVSQKVPARCVDSICAQIIDAADAALACCSGDYKQQGQCIEHDVFVHVASPFASD
jgi:hypothetical protein